MKYFKTVKSLEDLKNQFRELARKNHPDAGGDAEVMKAINQEYDQLFPIWKQRYNMQTANPTSETADSTRSEFYTQNGWKGSKHDWNRSIKEVAACIRAYVKELYPTYKFSVRFSTASMCQELHVSMVTAPLPIYKTFEELSHEEIVQVWLKAQRNHYVSPKGCLDEEMEKEVEEAYKTNKFLKIMTETALAVISDIDREVESYNFEDCDGMIDYFHVDFYYFGCKISEKFQIVPKTARIKKQTKEKKRSQKNLQNQESTLEVKEEQTEWIIGICSSEADGVSIGKFTGTNAQIREKLFQLVQEDRENDKDNWTHGTTEKDMVQDVGIQGIREFYAYGSYHNYHIDYTAKEVSCIANF